MRLSHPVHLKIARPGRGKVARFEREVRVAERLQAEVVQAMLVMRESAVVRGAALAELRVQVEQAVFLVVERDRERPVGRSETRRAVKAEPALVLPLASSRRRRSRDVMHALFHHHFYLPLQLQRRKGRPVVAQHAYHALRPGALSNHLNVKKRF